jgi:hypothetical protein
MVNPLAVIWAISLAVSLAATADGNVIVRAE